jgi:hypothetical protein
MSCHVLHGSIPNRSARLRAPFITVYSAADAFLIWGNSLATVSTAR